MATVKKLKVEYEADIKQLQSKLKRLEGTLKQSNTQVKKASNQFAGMWKQMLGGQVAFAAISKGLRMISRLLKDSVKAYGEQEKVERLLQKAMQATGQYSVAAFDELKRYASEIQNLTTVGDEASLKLMQLGLSMGVSTDKIKDATKYAIGLSKAYDMDLKSSMKMVALAFEGDFNMLQRYIPELKKLKDNTEKQAVAFKRFAEGWGIATEEAKTTEGQIIQFNNTLGDMKEKVGKALTDALLPAFKDLRDTITSEGFQEGLSAMVGAFAKILEYSLKIPMSVTRVVGLIVEINKVAGESADNALRNSVNQANAFYQMRDRLIKYGASYSELIAAMEDYQFAADGTRRTEMEQLLAVRKNKEEYPKLTKAIEAYEKAMRSGEIKTSDFAGAAGLVTDALEKKGLTKTVEELTYEMEDTSDQFDDTGKAAIDFGDDIDDISDAYKDLIAINIPMEIKRHAEEMEELKKKVPIIDSLSRSFIKLAEAVGISDQATESLSKELASIVEAIDAFASGDIEQIVSKGIESAAEKITKAIELIVKAFSSKSIEEWTEDWTEALEEFGAGSQEVYAIMQQINDEGLEIAEIQEHIAESIDRGIAALGNYYDFAATSQDRFNRAQLYTIALFGGLVSQGYSFVEAIMAMEDEFKKLAEIVAEQGWEISESLQDILDLTAFIEDNKELANAVSATADIMDALFQSSIYSISQMQALMLAFGQDVVDQFNQIIASGGTNEQAWAMVIPTLEKILYYSQQYGLAIDSQTQALIDQGLQAGYLIEANIPPMEQMVILLTEFIEMFADWIGAGWNAPWDNWSLPELPGGVGDEGAVIDKPIDIHAAKGFQGILDRDTTIRAHKGEGAMIIPKEIMTAPGVNNTYGDTNFNNHFPITNTGGESDMELSIKIARIMKNGTGGITGIMKKEINRVG